MHLDNNAPAPIKGNAIMGEYDESTFLTILKVMFI